MEVPQPRARQGGHLANFERIFKYNGNTPSLAFWYSPMLDGETWWPDLGVDNPSLSAFPSLCNTCQACPFIHNQIRGQLGLVLALQRPESYWCFCKIYKLELIVAYWQCAKACMYQSYAWLCIWKYNQDALLWISRQPHSVVASYAKLKRFWATCMQNCSLLSSLEACITHIRINMCLLTQAFCINCHLFCLLSVCFNSCYSI